MKNEKRLTCPNRRSRQPALGLPGRFARHAFTLLAAVLAQTVFSSENVPQRPFAQWANLPAKGQFVAGLVYEESESYHIWASGQQYNINTRSGGENYGIDINQGFLALQYGITEKWAADLEIGATTVGWRAFSPGNGTESTTGLMDWGLGVRYQIFNEAQYTNSPWVPTLTFRAGAVLPGSYNENFVYAPGFRSAAIVPELLLRKHFGWPGLGAYGDALYRWNRTSGNDNFVIAVGLFQQIKGWELDVGYMRVQTLSGSDIYFNVPGDLSSIVYPRDVRENNDSIQAGFSYTTSKRQWRYGFHTRTIVDGNNSDSKFWIGGSIDIPFGGKR